MSRRASHLETFVLIWHPIRVHRDESHRDFLSNIRTQKLNRFDISGRFAHDVLLDQLVLNKVFSIAIIRIYLPVI